jgi:hypothetical protein
MTKDDELGIAWWNRLTEREQKRWSEIAGNAGAKDAWEAFKASKRAEALSIESAGPKPRAYSFTRLSIIITLVGDDRP